MRKIKKALRRAWIQLRIYRVRYLRWWHRNDKKYTWRWRAANGLVALLLLVTIVMPVMQSVWEQNRYELSSEALQLTGRTDPSLAKQLTYDDSKQLYQFNKDAVATGDGQGLPAEIQKASVGATDKSNTKSYSLDIPKDFTEGVTYHDTNSQLSFKLVPEFKALPGKTEQGHLVFPLNGDNQAVYTLKNNGLKEDIIVPKVTQSSMRFDYTFELPKTLEVKAISDGDGAIGVYSASPTLFGDITYGSDADRDKVQKSRETAAKDTLVFGLPAPVVKDTDGKEMGTARFELNGNKLSVVAEGLEEGKGPITIDPSVVVTSTSDFQTNGNDEGMIDFGTSGQITRGGLTGATISAGWTTSTTFTTARATQGTVAYNGYMYVIGGDSGSSTAISDSQYAAINSDGTLGTWASTTSLPANRYGFTAVAYNGYMYVAGGTDGTTPYSSVVYAQINSNGTLGSWNTATSFATARYDPGTVAYNGYLYVYGGYNGGGLADVQYAAINADGSLGTWASTTSFSTGRRALGSVAYNGYLYVVGGDTGTGASGATQRTDVQYAKINNDGTVGTWAATTSFTTSRSMHGTMVYRGYLYIMGGYNSSFTNLTDVQYAQISANGTVGSWRTTATMAAGRFGMRTVAYNGYLYYIGGANSTPTRTNATYYAPVDRAGAPVAFGTLTNNFTTARALACSVAYNGYLYNIGGSTSDTTGNNVTTVQYTALNSSTGNNGSWSSTTALPATRGSTGCTAYNGYIYVIGGNTGTGGSGSSTLTAYYIAVNSNGTLAASWTSGTSLPSVSDKAGVFTYGTSGGTYLYAIVTGGGTNTVLYAPLNVSTGAIGSWTDSGQALVNNYGARAYAQVGKYIYAFGGWVSSTAYASVEYTSLNNDGSVNAWASTTSMNTAIGYTNGTTVNGCIYSVGGENGAATSLANVQYACPAANGTISAWYNAPNLSVATTDLGVTSYNGYIYGVGGYTTSVQTTTQFAYVNNGGSGANSAWTVGSNNLPASTLLNTATAYNGYLYSVGGNDGNNATLNSVRYSQLAANGDVGAFSTDARTFTTSREGAGTVAYNGYLYVVGGAADLGAAYYGDVQYAPIGSSGALSGNFANTNSFVTGTSGDNGRRGVCTVAYNGYLYAMGGYDGNANHTDTRYAAINSNGTVGSWADSGNNFTNGRAYMGCFVANGYLYVVGGNGSSKYNDVQAAQINNNGTLGTWNYTASFTGARSNMVVGYANGFAYITGGDTGSSGNYADTQYAPVYPNGAVGVWQQSTSSIGGTCAGFRSTGVVYNGAIYRLGGYSPPSCGVMSETGYAPLNSISRTARYSKLIDLGNPVSVSSITYNGTLPTSVSTPGVTPIYFRAAGSDKAFGSVTASGAITAGATACLATSQNYVRYLEVTILLDGSGGQAILPDAAGTLANVTDFTVNYITPHPAPNIRLRHGQTLQTGNLSPLDTCYP